MKYGIIISICLFLILCLIDKLFLKNIYKKKLTIRLDEEYKHEKNNFQEKIEKELTNEWKQLENAKKELNSLLQIIEFKKHEIENLSKQINDKQNFNSQLMKMKEKEIERLVDEKKKRAIEILEVQIENWAKSAQEAANFNFSIENNKLNKEKEKIISSIKELETELNEFKNKRDAINEAILQSRAIKEKEDFYRIVLDESSLNDIHYLLSVVDDFKHKETVYKLIWTEYIQKPFKKMLNNVLSNKDPRNVIYMIQNLDTQEIYIGKTQAEVSKRWTEHIKSSLNIGSVSAANFHKALYNNWDRFSFNILEIVDPNENLGQREKYYIDFYQSNIYGYNMKNGG